MAQIVARLYQRGRVWWAVAHADGVRRRWSLGTEDRAAAERKLAAPNPTTVAAALERYRAYSSVRRAAKTNATALGYLAKALDGIGAQTVAEITRTGVVDYLTARAQAGASPKTLNHIRSELRVFFGWLVDRGELQANPVDRVRSFHVPAPSIRFLGHEDIAAMRKAVAGDLIEPLVLTLLYAGLRRSEAIWLDWADVDLGRGLLAVRAKAGWQPKTRRNRTVPISGKLREVLEPLARPHPWAFPSPQGCRWDPDNLTARFRARMEKAGLAWTLLDLRRTFGSHLIRKPGMSYARLAALMGNSAAICARHYAHVAPEELAADVDF